IFIWPVLFHHLVQLVNRPIVKWHRQCEMRKMVLENHAYDHGAASSLREQVSSSGLYRQYFQKLDQEMHMKILERQILDTIIRFLADRNVDTSDLKESQTQIINGGIIVSAAASVEASALVVGGQSTTLTRESDARGGIKSIKNLVGRSARAG